MVRSAIPRAHTTEEYVAMIEQAIDDAWDLRQSIEYDEDYMADARGFIDQLENSLKQLYQSMKDGKYKFATGDLPFMEIVGKYHDAHIPFKFLLKRINETHLKGLDV
jgi:hypothetical protein